VQSAADRFAPENWEYRPTCGSELEMHIRYDPTCDAWAEDESIDLGTGQPNIEDGRRWQDM